MCCILLVMKLKCMQHEKGWRHLKRDFCFYWTLLFPTGVGGCIGGTGTTAVVSLSFYDDWLHAWGGYGDNRWRALGGVDFGRIKWNDLKSNKIMFWSLRDTTWCQDDVYIKLCTVPDFRVRHIVEEWGYWLSCPWYWIHWYREFKKNVRTTVIHQ